MVEELGRVSRDILFLAGFWNKFCSRVWKVHFSWPMWSSIIEIWWWYSKGGLTWIQICKVSERIWKAPLIGHPQLLIFSSSIYYSVYDLLTLRLCRLLCSSVWACMLCPTDGAICIGQRTSTFFPIHQSQPLKVIACEDISTSFPHGPPILPRRSPMNTILRNVKWLHCATQSAARLATTQFPGGSRW